MINYKNKIEQYNLENQQLADFFFNKYFLQDFLEKDNSKKVKNLELIISPKCNLGCKYCYINNHRAEIFSEQCFNNKNIIKNLKLILKWLERNRYNPNLEIFSGEIFAQEIGFTTLEIIYQHYLNIEDKTLIPHEVIVPSNFTFVSDDDVFERVKNIRQKYLNIGINFILSASIDGKYVEENRPHIKDLDIHFNNHIRDDKYYDKVMSYIKENNIYLHPMIYSDNIDKWIDNFSWFQEQFEKYGINWKHLYLLQVRNEEWTKDQIHSFGKFIDFLYSFIWEKVNHNKEEFVTIILREGFNIIKGLYTHRDNGVTCGIQDRLPIRVGDLKVYPCHRLGYKDLIYGEMTRDKDQVLKFKCYNLELMIASYAIDRRSIPLCAQCPVNELCVGPCFGACYESNKNMLVPIPSVCLLTYQLAISSIKNLKKYGVFGIVANKITEEKLIQLEALCDLIKYEL